MLDRLSCLLFPSNSLQFLTHSPELLTRYFTSLSSYHLGPPPLSLFTKDLIVLLRKPVTLALPKGPRLTSSSIPTMISDNDLYSLAIFLGSLAMLLIVLYHFLQVNAIEDDPLRPSGTKQGGEAIDGKSGPPGAGIWSGRS